jgi:hypothetical protein
MQFLGVVVSFALEMSTYLLYMAEMTRDSCDLRLERSS